VKFFRFLPFLLMSVCWGQTFVGSVRGLIEDPGGAVVAGAKVTLRNQATNVTRDTVSNTGGEYVFAQLQPATYTIEVEVAGFKKLVRPNVVVGAAQQIGLDLKLELGAVTESVQVTTEVPVIENATASNGQVLDTQQMEDLPNLGRNSYLMSKLANNVVPSGPPTWNRFQDQIGSSALSIGGGPIRGNNYTIDGVPITSSQNLAIIIPSQSAVDEMKLQENTYDATMGRTGGGVFNTVIKSGTNSLHGDALGYIRPEDMTANLWFNNAAGSLANGQPVDPRPFEEWENWEFSLGGPVWIPKVYNGKNKTFFFVNTEGYFHVQPDAGARALPTAQELAGNFSASGKTIYDPLSGVACGPTSGCPAGATVVRTPFPNNMIPGNMINPIGRAILGYLPAPNENPGARIDTTDYEGSDTLGNHANEVVARVDEDPTEWLRLSGSFLWYHSFEPGSNPLNIADSGTYLLYRWVDSTQVNAIITANPTTVITGRYGFNRFPNIYDYRGVGFNQTSLGFPASYVSQQEIAEFPGTSLSEAGTNFGGGSYSNTTYWSKNASFSVSKATGKHSLTMGFDYRLIHTDGAGYSNPAGSFTYNGIFTQQYNSGTSTSTGSDIADMLLGYPSAGSVGYVQNTYFFVNYYAGYIQDDIRVTNKLTINAGLRYEYETGEAEQYDNMLVGFNRTALNPIQADIQGAGLLAYGTPEVAGQNGNPTACCDALKDKFGPRAGFAYAINDKTVFRGGWGIFYAPIYFSLDNQFSPGLSQITTYLATTDGFATPANSLSNPFPGGILHPAGINQGVNSQYGGTLYYPDPNRTNGIVQQFSADIQRQLPWGVGLEVGYQGSRSSRLQFGSTGGGLLPINQVPTQYLSLGSGLTKSVPNPFYGTPAALGVLGGATVSQAQLLQPYPEYQSVLDYSNGATAEYDSLIIRAQKRLSHGATFVSTFTWARNYDDEFGSASSNYYNSDSGSAAPGYPQNVYNLGAEWALGAGTVPWRYTGGFTYQLPFGKGKPLANNNRFLDYVVGGWSLNGVVIIESGFPLFVYQTNANTIIGTSDQRPNATGVAPTGSGTPESRLYNYINPAAFSLAPQYTFGNVSRDIPNLGPGLNNFDLSLFKDFTIKERFTGEFRVESFDAFNTPNFNQPYTLFQGVQASGAPVGNFGRILSQANLSREVQLGIRLFF